MPPSLSITMPPVNESIIFQYFDELSLKQQAQFRRVASCYKSWNEKLNLISRMDIEHIYLKHVLHSLCVAKVVKFKSNTRILDVGTGGGFPGIPLAIMFPQAEFHLIDSIGKKIRAVQQIAEELELANVTTYQCRAEQVVEPYDFILGRAVTRLPIFYDWVKHNIAQRDQHPIPNGVLYLRGVEAVSIAVQHRIYPVNNFFSEPFFSNKQLVHLYK